MKKTFIFHPFLFAIYPILFLFSHNIYQIMSMEVIIVPTALTLFFALSLYVFLSFIFKDKKKAGIVISLLLVVVFSYGHAFNVIKDWQLFNSIAVKNRYLMSIWGIFFFFAVYFVLTSRRNLQNFTSILNIVAVTLLVIPLINIGGYKFKTRVAWLDNRNAYSEKAIEEVDTKKAETLRDIYYFIFDRYSSAEMLKGIFNFDNNEFINYLSDKGFYVASKSTSNYLTTDHSLASSLNMEFINYLSEKVGKESNDFSILYSMIQDNKVWRFLKSKGYKYIHFGSKWQPTSQNRYADINYSYYALSEFSGILYKTTIFYPIGVYLGIFDQRREHWEKILYKFDKLSEIPDIKQPTFTFVHMLIPHTPYVFDRNGNYQSEEKVYSKSRSDSYLEQLMFVNKKIKVLIDKLLSNSEVSPIIIIQADEGSFPKRLTNPLNFNWKHATNKEIRQKMSILNAYYFPDVDKSELYQSITPVNSFRILFNLYFNAGFELLPDENYAYTEKQQPYNFFSVTDYFKKDREE